MFEFDVDKTKVRNLFFKRMKNIQLHFWKETANVRRFDPWRSWGHLLGALKGPPARSHARCGQTDTPKEAEMRLCFRFYFFVLS